MGFNGSIFLQIITPLLGISLMFTSAYAWWNISRLYLPISRFLGFLSTFLPILSLASIQYLRNGNRQSSKSRRRKNAQAPQISDKMFLGIFGLLLLDTALLTLTSTSLPTKQLLCPLNEDWTNLWSSPAERKSPQPAIKTIQDNLSCCGLHSSHDKYFPFPPGGRPRNGSHPCTEFYPDRKDRPCFQPWLHQNQLSAGLFLATIAGSMLMKVAALTLIRCKNHPWVQRALYNSWFGKQHRVEEEEATTGEGRISNIEDDDTFHYDADARVRGNGDRDSRGRYRPDGENDRLLGNGDEDTGDARRSDIYNDAGFGTLQPSLLR